METEVRFYFSNDSEDKIIEYLKKIKKLNYVGRFYEKTDQYNHPMKKYDFYSKKIDGRFRVRLTEGNNLKKCMITWKRRLNNNKEELIHQEEEIEVSINYSEYNNLVLLLKNVLHLELVESYERYRTIFKNNDIEIVVDKYPFGIAVEIESKSENKEPTQVVSYWIDKLGFDIKEAYKLSWDDKYSELCNNQNKKVSNIVRFNMDMTSVKNRFNIQEN